MTKSKIALVFLLVGISSAQAASFHGMDGVDRGCKLAKFTGGKWFQADEKDVSGQDVTNVTPSKANSDFSNFKFQGTWYAAKNECIKDADGGASADSGGADMAAGGAKKYFAEIKLQKTLLFGTINPTSTTGYTTTTATSSYGSGLGFDGRFGYHWKENKYFFFDLSTLPASQNVTVSRTAGGGSTALAGTLEPVSDSILLINVGYMMTFQKPLWGTHPYAAGMLGYGHLSGSVTNVESYSGGGIDLGVEGGLVKDFSTHWSALASLGLTYLSINPSVTTATSTALSPAVGTSLGSRSYTHFTLALGGRYSF